MHTAMMIAYTVRNAEPQSVRSVLGQIGDEFCTLGGRGAAVVQGGSLMDGHHAFGAHLRNVLGCLLYTCNRPTEYQHGLSFLQRWSSQYSLE